METITDRIQKVMKDKGIKNKDISEKLNISSASVSQFVNGKTKPSNANIRLFCKQFHVNEEWMRTGEGNPYFDVSDDFGIERMMAEVLNEPDDSSKKKFFAVLAQMEPEFWDQVAEFMRKLNA